MAITAQELDHRITIQRATVVYDEFNSPVETWSDLATVWARRRDVSDGEKVAAGQVGATLMSRFTVRSTTTTRDMKPTDRLNYDGAIWNIHGLKEADEGRNRFIEITAIRDAD
ncbi:phage head closure protein [Sinorhizobium meliloti]|uniref:phage head closure protein n=1 Tax=Rhizobium meliloti TaxID=382 RepID=UPI000FDC1A82|nr:phage head closure protein [Sinorhizobium meliloti]RVG20291.1 head-tail adaptor protein [Sinorhizobium meliloti]